jgi:DNA-binding transcriptional LysR family regulator
LITSPAPPGSRFDADGEGLTQAALRARLTINSAEAAVDAAAAGIGGAHVLSYQAAPAVRAGKVRLTLGAPMNRTACRSTWCMRGRARFP